MAHQDRYLLFLEYFNKAKFMSAQTTLEEGLRRTIEWFTTHHEELAGLPSERGCG